LRRGLALVLLTAGAVALASQWLRPFRLDVGSALGPPLATDGLYPAESGFRWTAGRATIVLPAIGRGRPVVLVAVLSAWRPRASASPQVRIAAGDLSAVATIGPSPAEITVGPVRSDAWRGALALRIDSDTFAPGRGDPRTLGARVHEIRVAPADGAWAPGAPPLALLLWAMLAVPLVLAIASATGARPSIASASALALLALVVMGVIVARVWTARLLPVLVTAEVVVLGFAVLLPGRVRAVLTVTGDALGRLASAARALAHPVPLALLTLLASLGTVLAYRAKPVVSIPMGSGRETSFESGLGSFDAADGIRFRHVAAPASLDLRDLGGGGRWRATLTAAAPGPDRVLALADLGAGVSEGVVGSAWSEHEIAGPAPVGWRSGLIVTLPGARREDVWVRDLVIDRGRAWPSIRVIAGVLALGLGLALAIVAAGLAPRAGWVAATAAIALVVTALAVDPIAAIPAVPRLVAVVALGAMVTALAAAARGASSTGDSLPSAAVAAGGLGFMAWLAATTTSLYRGGHFVFHSSIAEEIWKGRFLLYYLPYPGSMLSQQAQWGNVVVPHPCLYHTLVAPLAALPRPAFFTAEKVVLALLLAAMAWASAALGARLGPPRAAAFSAILMASMPASFQLLGLGHLMTILGCWAMTMAVVYLATHAERLGERRSWWRAVMVLALCFLAYFAGLLFMGIVIVIAALALWRADRALARALVSAAAAAAAIAFVLYYVNWTWPFLSRSLPQLLGGSGAQTGSSAGALSSRLAAVPHKLAYTFGSAWVPVLGIAGLLWTRRGAPRVLLLAWAAILPLFTVLDLSFNFLLKHHYFTMVPVAVGGGVLLARLAERGPWGRMAAAAVMVAFAVLGARVGLDAATGRIP